MSELENNNATIQNGSTDQNNNANNNNMIAELLADMQQARAEGGPAAANNNNNNNQQMMNNNIMGMYNPMMMNSMMNSAMLNNPMMMASMMNNMDMSSLMNNSNGMTPQQIMMAYAGGSNMPMLQPSQEDPNWEDRYFELQAFKREKGHCRVPARYKANPKLGRWVMTQRRQFTLLMQGYPNTLTAERINRLEGIGFTWCIRPEPVKTWNSKFQELMEYKNTYGNCNVPQRYQDNPKLGTWVHTQRRQYKLMIEGKKSSMTQEKIQALDSIGFFWTTKPNSSSRSMKDDAPRNIIGQRAPMNNSASFAE